MSPSFCFFCLFFKFYIMMSWLIKHTLYQILYVTSEAIQLPTALRFLTRKWANICRVFGIPHLQKMGSLTLLVSCTTAIMAHISSHVPYFVYRLSVPFCSFPSNCILFPFVDVCLSSSSLCSTQLGSHCDCSPCSIDGSIQSIRSRKDELSTDLV